MKVGVDIMRTQPDQGVMLVMHDGEKPCFGLITPTAVSMIAKCLLKKSHIEKKSTKWLKHFLGKKETRG